MEAVRAMREFVRHIHFVGIGGIGMSGIAEVLLELNFTVSGSDINAGERLQRLRKSGARIMRGHDAAHIDGAEVVVASSAVHKDNIELAAARHNNIPVVPRAEMLGELMRFRRGIAIAGTHGKTTTTSLVSAVLAGAGLDPTFIVGGVVNSAGACARLGTGEHMVVEADESDASFLHLQPQMAVLTNIDADHLETYGGDFEKLKAACLLFLQNLPFYGLAALCFDDAAVRDIAASLHKPMVSYGFAEGVDFRAVGVRQVGRDSFFALERHGQPAGEYRLALPGRHNVLNALAAIAIASRLGLADADVTRALAAFEGIGRRFEVLGEVALDDGRATLVDDYAHHPTELRATLAAARDCWPQRRQVVIFQPHRYTRTRDLFDDFVRALADLETLIITAVYPAGEAAIAGAGGRALCRALRARGVVNLMYVGNMAELRDLLPNVVRHDDVLLTLGAGDISRFAQSMAATGLRRRSPS